ncbi:uncharacterized protein [Triticum aestivum]|uniref:uncharacterized protein isoform X2 n=1 Tax=Triticum aestivum TaxID=4565 RepID=UPI001D01EA91|nr:uncharacterized protein LOC123180228 isoform X2 [Triticum aestivum]
MPRGKEMGKRDQRGKEQGVASHTGSSSASPLLAAEEDRYQQPMAPSQLVLLTTGSEEGTKAKVKNDFSGRFNLGEVRRTTEEKSCIPGGLRSNQPGKLRVCKLARQAHKETARLMNSRVKHNIVREKQFSHARDVPCMWEPLI